MKNLIQKFKKKLLISLPLKFKKKIITGLGKGHKRALVYFKTDPFFSKELRKAYIHTNNEEIVLMVGVLNDQGYQVDLIDRDACWEEIKTLSGNNYDLYIGNAAGNSATFHVEIMRDFKIGKRVLFAAGPEAYLSNELVHKQHQNFALRNNKQPVVRRLVKGEAFEKRYEPLDAIITIGETFSAKSYERLGKKIYPILPSLSPLVRHEDIDFNQKNPKKFIYFGGSGNICKGLDVVIEAFAGLKGVEIDICAPEDEQDFWDHYQDILKNNPHIRYRGFVPVGGKLFHELTHEAAWVVFPTAAEGCATSITVCMRRGIIPVINYEGGIHIGDFGIALENNDPLHVREVVQKILEMPKEELRLRGEKTLRESQRYSIDGFVKTFSEIVQDLSR